MKIAWRTYADLTARCLASLPAVRAVDPHVIVGVPRSGMLPASILATALGLPLGDVYTFCAGRAWRVSGEPVDCDARRALIVDDASGYGRTMGAAMKMIKAARPEVHALSCAVYADPEAAALFTLAMEPLAKPRLFQWNWWRSGKLAYCCVDIDGVLCPDPVSEEKCTPDAFRAFIANVPMIYRPQKKVGAFVTGRGAAYRADTEDWLRVHRVTYDALLMLDGRSPRTVEGHAEHKAACYRRLPASLFIESDERQARLIAQMAGKPALCIATGQMF